MWVHSVQFGMIHIRRTTEDTSLQAGSVALTLGHPIQEFMYLSHGIKLDCVLATCDGRFSNKARAVYWSVRLLGDFERDTFAG